MLQTFALYFVLQYPNCVKCNKKFDFTHRRVMYNLVYLMCKSCLFCNWKWLEKARCWMQRLYCTHSPIAYMRFLTLYWYFTNAYCCAIVQIPYQLLVKAKNTKQVFKIAFLLTPSRIKPDLSSYYLVCKLGKDNKLEFSQCKASRDKSCIMSLIICVC